MIHKGRRVLLALLLIAAAVGLCACSQNHSADYEKAIDLFSKGDYAEAARAFEKLGDYAQAQIYAAYSQGLVFYDPILPRPVALCTASSATSSAMP